ncbi:hypothetical protein [Amycolatopsis sp. NPDC004378]
MAPVLRADLPERPGTAAGLAGAAAQHEEKTFSAPAPQQEVEEPQRRFIAPLRLFDDDYEILFPEWPGKHQRTQRAEFPVQRGTVACRQFQRAPNGARRIGLAREERAE